MRVRTSLILTAALVVLSSSAARAQGEFVGFLADTSGSSRSTERFVLHVDAFTTDEEATAFLKVLKEKGTEGLVKALGDAPEKGYIKIGTRLGYPVAVVRSLATPDGGRVVRALTDRQVMMFESMRNTRSKEYPIGIIEMKLDAKGEGEGAVIAAAKAKFTDEGRLEVESMGSKPIKILSVKLEPAKEASSKDKK